MLGAFADGIDAGMRGVQPVVDQHAALGGEACRAGETCLRPHAGRHHDERAGQLAAVFQAHGFGVALAEDLGCMRF
jgi:hypothetical protein